jgi:hypothetical protein
LLIMTSALKRQRPGSESVRFFSSGKCLVK